MIICLLIILAVVLLASWLAAPPYFQKRVQQRIDHTKKHWAFDKIPISKMRRLLQKYEPSKWITTNEERKFYDALPDNGIFLYRGCCIDEAISGEYGISWTARRDVAEFFAFRYTTEQRAVFSTTISKENIRAVLTEREEAECLILEPTNVQVVTTEPTEYYDKYQEFRAEIDRKEQALRAEVAKMWQGLLKNE